ncbi:hypothetical protein TanjilG_22574 [Lupinus angustifolius]|uniref:Uncharacterized protein n=1 Tax=Lupinus angustifolius TaxID=3871 RepID=A0A4P1RT32_LUPAN|nr:PREDICTED: coiled-coil domain-containing protein 102A-like [Lupinus angustifolius]OIW17462.1 hypothetical protein TanjilG_22574 [Lupinus angustifolius]
MSISQSSSLAVRDVDPLLKDLIDTKLSFRRNVASLAAQFKELRHRLASQDQSYTKQILTRQEAELKAKSMEVEIGILQRKLEERNEQIQDSGFSAMKYLKELDDLRTQLSAARASADANAASAQSAQLQYFELLQELNEKNKLLIEHEDYVLSLVKQLENIQKDLLARESSQMQLKDGVLRIEHDIMEVLAKAGENKDCALRKVLDEVSRKNFGKMDKFLVVKDVEIAKLKDDIEIMSAHWKLKTKRLESQLEKQQHIDQELKKRVLKLEFCLQEAHSETRKLQRMGEQQDKAIKELRDQLAATQQSGVVDSEKQISFWETYGFKIMVSMSIVIIVVFSKG